MKKSKNLHINSHPPLKVRMLLNLVGGLTVLWLFVFGWYLSPIRFSSASTLVSVHDTAAGVPPFEAMIEIMGGLDNALLFLLSTTAAALLIGLILLLREGRLQESLSKKEIFESVKPEPNLPPERAPVDSLVPNSSKK